MAGFSLQKEVITVLNLPDGTEVRLAQTDYDELCSQIISDRPDLVRAAYPLVPTASAPASTHAPAVRAARRSTRNRRNLDQITDAVLTADKAHWMRLTPSSLRSDRKRLHDFLVRAVAKNTQSQLAQYVRTHSLDALFRYFYTEPK